MSHLFSSKAAVLLLPNEITSTFALQLTEVMMTILKLCACQSIGFARVYNVHVIFSVL